MPPEERRASLIQAVIPLLREYGTSVTTRQIAHAAGVAEGTIFGVFPDKESLIHAALLTALDPAPLERSLQQLPAGLDIRERLQTIGTLTFDHLAENATLLSAMRRSKKDGELPPPPPGPPPGPHPPEGFFAALHRSHERTVEVMATAMGPCANHLRVPPRTLAVLLLGLLAMKSRAGISPLNDIDTEDIVTLALDGALIQPTV